MAKRWLVVETCKYVLCTKVPNENTSTAREVMQSHMRSFSSSFFPFFFFSEAAAAASSSFASASSTCLFKKCLLTHFHIQRKTKGGWVDGLLRCLAALAGPKRPLWWIARRGLSPRLAAAEAEGRSSAGHHGAPKLDVSSRLTCEHVDGLQETGG